MLEDDYEEYLQQYEAGRTICREGEEGGSFFLIKEGLAQVSYEGEGGKTITLNTLGPGDIFGEMALLGSSSVRSATVRSETSLRCWKFSDEKFEALLETSESFREQVMKLLTNRLRESNQRLAEVRELQHLLYRCSRLIVDLIDRLGPVETARTTLSSSPTIRTLTSWFDLSESSLVSLLENPTIEELQNLPESLQGELLETARSMVRAGLEQVTFQIRPPEPSGDEDSPQAPERLLDDVQSLHERVDSKSADELRRNSSSLRQKHRDLNRRRSKLTENADSKQSSKTVDSYLREINRMLIEAGVEDQEST